MKGLKLIDEAANNGWSQIVIEQAILVITYPVDVELVLWAPRHADVSDQVGNLLAHVIDGVVDLASLAALYMLALVTFYEFILVAFVFHGPATVGVPWLLWVPFAECFGVFHYR